MIEKYFHTNQNLLLAISFQQTSQIRNKCPLYQQIKSSLYFKCLSWYANCYYYLFWMNTAILAPDLSSKLYCFRSTYVHTLLKFTHTIKLYSLQYTLAHNSTIFLPYTITLNSTIFPTTYIHTKKNFHNSLRILIWRKAYPDEI